MRRIALIAVAALAATSLSGCFDFLVENTALYSDDDLAGLFNQTDELVVSLEDFPEGADAVLWEVVLEETGPLTSSHMASFPTSDGQRLGPLEIDQASPPFCLRYFGPGGGVQSASYPIGPRLESSYTDPLGPITLDLDADSNDGPDRGTADPLPGRLGWPVLIALKDAQAWREQGATWSVTVSGDEPIWVRSHGAVHFDCVVGVSDMEGGSYLDAGFLTTAADRTHTFRVQQLGFFMGVAMADGTHDVDVTGPNGTIFEDVNNDPTTWEYAGFGELVGPGDYVLSVDEFTGRNTPLALSTVVVGLADVPRWVFGLEAPPR